MTYRLFPTYQLYHHEDPSKEIGAARTDKDKFERRRQTQQHKIIYINRNAKVTESDESYFMRLRLAPSVKRSDVSIEVNGGVMTVYVGRKQRAGHDGNNTAKCSRAEYCCPLNDRTIAISCLVASMSNGELTIKAPKKAPLQPISINIMERNSPPVDGVCREQKNSHETTRSKLEWSLLIPGVSTENLSAKLCNDYLIIAGERTTTKGGSIVITKVRRRLFIDRKQVDTSSLQGYVIDGIVTITALAKKKSEESCMSGQQEGYPTVTKFSVPVFGKHDTLFDSNRSTARAQR